MTTQTHSPLPWIYTKDGFITSEVGIIAELYRPFNEARDPDESLAARNANAQLIVSAVNSHAALVEALEKALPVLIEACEKWSNGKDCYQESIDSARAALVLAKGGGGK